ncbi:MAG: hypothetical protein ACI9XO_001622 [Paraglaciecola sp.]|jgi:hypothetical protein
MKKSGILLVLWSISLFVNAQNKEDKMMVISTTGLNFRAEPFTTAKIIGKIGYGEEVVVIEKLKETIYTLNSKYGRYSEEKTYKIPIEGYWVKANYEGEVGYLFSGYLCNIGYFSWPPKNKFPNLNQDYYLLFETGNCWFNFPKENNWYWYGFFLDNNGKDSFRKINPSFYVSEDHNPLVEPFSFYVFSNTPSYPNFIIGSKKELLERTEVTQKDFTHLNQKSGSSYQPNILNKKLKASGIIQRNSTKYANGELYIRDEQGTEYSMGISRLRTNGVRESFLINVLFKGDINNDGIDDYILTFGDKSSQTILFLSSAAKEGELVAPVAVYYSGYCC